MPIFLPILLILYQHSACKNVSCTSMHSKIQVQQDRLLESSSEIIKINSVTVHGDYGAKFELLKNALVNQSKAVN
jgi:hypothetical protein